MKTIQSSEYMLTGQWLRTPTGTRADETAQRIEWLIEHVLQKLADSPRWGAWETLYRDPADGRLWERTFPQGDLQGGGPPQLAIIEVDLACEKYGIPVRIGP